MIKVLLREDDSSHTYIIPEELVVAFDSLSEKISNSVEYSDSWYELIGLFNENFAHFRENPSNIDLYIREPFWK